MKKLLPLAAIAGALVFAAVGSAQAAPVSSNVLGKMTTASQDNSVVEKAHYRHHRKWYNKRYYKKRHHHHHRRWHRWH